MTSPEYQAPTWVNADDPAFIEGVSPDLGAGYLNQLSGAVEDHGQRLGAVESDVTTLQATALDQADGDARYILQSNANGFAPAEATATALAGKAATSANLSDLASAATARANLGLAAAAASGKLADATDVTTTGAAVGKVVAATAVSGGVPTAFGLIDPPVSDLPEASSTARTTADATTENLLSKTTRYDTSSAAISQTLPAATAGRLLAAGWDAGTNALTLTAAGTDVIGSGASASLVLPLSGEVLTLHCTTAGRWRIVTGFKPQASLDSRFPLRSRVAVNVKDFGAKGDGRVVYDAATTASSATVTSATANFTSADVGKWVTVASNAGVYTSAGTVSTVVNSTTITVSNAPSQTLTAASLVVASDDRAAFQAALATIPQDGYLYIPVGVYGFSGSLAVPAGVSMVGDGHDYGLVERTAKGGSILMLMNSLAALATFVLFGDGTTTLGSGNAAARVEHLVVDAQNLADNAFRMRNPRQRARFCQFWRGRARALFVDSQNSMVNQCVVGQQSVGDALYIAAGDVKVINCDIRQGGGNQIHALNADDIQILGNHLYGAYNGTITNAPGGANVLLQYSSGGHFCAMVHDNLLDGTNGPMVKVEVLNSGTSMTGVSVHDNQLLQNNGWPSDTYPVVEVAVAASATLRGMSVAGTTGIGLANATPANYTAIVAATGVGTLSHYSVMGNTVRQAAAVYTGQRPDAVLGNLTSRGNFAPVYRSENSGLLTANGTGAQTAFTIAHGLDMAPQSVRITPGSAAAATPFYATADATNITVTFTTAPASGTGNVALYWNANI